MKKFFLICACTAIPVFASANSPYLKPGEHEARLVSVGQKGVQYICTYTVPSQQGQTTFRISMYGGGCSQSVAYNDTSKLARQHYTGYHAYVSYVSNPPKQASRLTDEQMKEVRQRRQAAIEQDKRDGTIIASAVFTKEGEPPRITIHGKGK